MARSNVKSTAKSTTQSTTKTDVEKLLLQRVPRFLLEIMHKYFRVQVEGAEHLPRRGAAVIAANHSGFSGFDAMIAMHEIREANGRLPKVLAHKLWYLVKATAIPLQKLGFIEASYRNGLKELEKNHLVIIFPEGEFGNFKPTTKAYQLQEFKRGFVRMAIETGAPIIPTMIVGAEETHINLNQISFTKFMRGMILPLPLNFIPLPAKWKIKFLKPIYLPYKPSAINDSELMNDIASDIREHIQECLRQELGKRKSAYFG